MAVNDGTRRLIANADDFGRSSSINQAVVRAHREGILTTASLMVNEPAAAEAVELARQNPALGVGLHLTLVCGKSALSRKHIPGLADERGRFSQDPARTGFRYFFMPSLQPQLEWEIARQFEKFKETGLPLDHVNGHLNIHLHPVIFRLLMKRSQEWGIRHFRLTRDPFRLNMSLAGGSWIYRLSHALSFHSLSAFARSSLSARGIRHTGAVFGLLQNSRVDSAYLEKLLARLPSGDSELYSHPSLDDARHEFEAMASPRIKALTEELGIQRIRYRDL
jgi:hopanoid biosynthesis associated protein HpnK